MADTASSHDGMALREALESAHHPTLAVVLVHLTGDTKWLGERYQPVYEPILGDPDGGLSEETKAELRETVAEAMDRIRETGEMPPAPDRETLKRMMDFCATEPIPEEYLDFLFQELALEGQHVRMPGHGIAFAPDEAADLKVIIIGAGMSGLLAGIVLQRAGIAFEIIEKNDEVGGTWYDNTYPGCRVDTPNHLYSYSFEADHDWPAHFSTQDVLLDYFKQIADKYDLRRHIRFNTEVVSAVYDEDTARWTVTTRAEDGRETELTGNAVIAAVGQLNQPKLPDIEGVGNFQGPAFHSARWDHSVDLKGKRVGVIGTGASAFQFIPAIAPEVGHMTVFQRTPGWLVPTPDYHDAVPEGKHYLLKHLPFYQTWFRFFQFLTMADGPLQFLVKDPDYPGHDYAPNEPAAEIREQIEDYIRAQAEGDAALAEAVVPTFHLSGKRSLRDNGVWVSALKRDNVTLDTTPIARITETGVVTEDGVQHDFDVLIYGTGFKASEFLTPMEIRGEGGKELHEVWNEDARAYLGITMPGFPNFFMMYGPNTNIVVNASIIFFSECEMHYILGCLKLLQEKDADALTPKRSVFDQYNAEVDAANAEMPWGYADAPTWYRNKYGRVAQNWPFRMIDYWNKSRTPNPEDFDFR